MDLQALAAEIANDPTAMGYGNFLPDSPGYVVELLNRRDRIGPRQVPLGEIAGLLEMTPGALRSLRAASINTGLPEIVQDSADVLVRICERRTPLEVIDMTDAKTAQTVPAMLGGLVQAGVISSDINAAIISLGVGVTSRAAILGLETVTENHLRLAGVI